MRPAQPAPHDAYITVTSVPGGLRWVTRAGYHKNLTYETLFSINNTYKLMRVRNTGAVQYFKLKDEGTKASSPEHVDAELTAPPQQRFRTGAHCWFVNDTRWFLVQVVRRIAPVLRWVKTPKRIVIRSVTGFDALRRTPWSYGDELELIADPHNRLFRQLRKLSARKL